MFQIIVGLAAVMTASAFVGVQTTTRNAKTIVMAAEKSKSLPFLPQPPNIVGMPGDVGKTHDTAIHKPLLFLGNYLFSTIYFPDNCHCPFFNPQ